MIKRVFVILLLTGIWLLSFLTNVYAVQNPEAGQKHVFLPEVIQDLTVPEEVYTDLGDESLNEICDIVLTLILKDLMTEEEKAYAIYSWVTKAFVYVGKPEFPTWQACAADVFASYTGDCYAFYAGLRALLQRAGIRCMEASTASKDHYWVMAQIDGQWRHLDATPGWGEQRFMLTTEELQNYCYMGNSSYPEGLSYDFEPKVCPVTAVQR